MENPCSAVVEFKSTSIWLQFRQTCERARRVSARWRTYERPDVQRQDVWSYLTSTSSEHRLNKAPKYSSELTYLLSKRPVAHSDAAMDGERIHTLMLLLYGMLLRYPHEVGHLKKAAKFGSESTT